MLGMTQLLWEGPVARLLGLLAARLGRWDQAWAHFEAAIDHTRRLDAKPYLARTRYEYARALQLRGAPGDPARAAALYQEARAGAEALGMTGLLRLIATRTGAIASGPTPAPTGPAAASGRPTGASGSRRRRRRSCRRSCRRSAGSSFHDPGRRILDRRPPGGTFRLKDSLGLRYLQRLLAQPDQEIHVLELAGGRDATGEDPAIVDSGDAGELLDPEARDSYRRRLEDLREELAEAEANADTLRASRAREEIEFLGAELSRAIGLGGRGRRAGGAAERARSAVQRRIRNALDRIAEHAPALRTYLEHTLKTGTFCVYRPTTPTT